MVKQKKPPRLDPTDMSKHGSATVQPLDRVIEKAVIRSKGFDNLDVDRVSDLKIEWQDKSDDNRAGGWFAQIGSRKLMLSPQAVRTASQLVGQRDPQHWMQYPDRNAFPKALAHILDNPAMVGNRKNSKRLLVRHDGIFVRAILPFVYSIRDAADLLESFGTMITKHVGKVNGVSVLDDSERRDSPNLPGDLMSYRFVVGQNIIPQLKDELGQYMMFLLGISETGAKFPGGGDCCTSLGLFRTICTNSAVRASLTSVWNHRSKGLEKFLGDTTERIRTTGYYQDGLAAIFKELVATKLVEVKPADMLTAFHNEKLITSGHFDAANMLVREKTEDGRDVETQYDLFNVLTQSAQHLDSLAQRQSAETRTLHLFTEKGGIFERLRNAATDRAREDALRRGRQSQFVD